MFEVFISGEVPDITSFFEAFAGESIREISLCKLFVICKKLISAIQLASDIERANKGGKMHVKITHQFSDEKVVLKLVELFSKLFWAAGYMF